jgi:hypothetical protein
VLATLSEASKTSIPWVSASISGFSGGAVGIGASVRHLPTGCVVARRIPNGLWCLAGRCAERAAHPHCIRCQTTSRECSLLPLDRQSAPNLLALVNSAPAFLDPGSSVLRVPIDGWGRGFRPAIGSTDWLSAVRQRVRLRNSPRPAPRLSGACSGAACCCNGPAIRLSKIRLSPWGRSPEDVTKLLGHSALHLSARLPPPPATLLPRGAAD